MWADVAPALATRFTVLNVDARGHGRSVARGPFTLEDLAEDWRAILDREAIERAALCGLSMGGMTAMRLAVRAPERVAALALVDTSARGERPRSRPKYRLLAEALRLLGFRDALFPPAVRSLFGATARRERPELVARTVARIRENDPRQIYPACRAVFGRASVLDTLGAIRCPTLVLCGEEDVATKPRESRLIAGRIPGARLVELPRTGHLSALEAPDAVAAHVGAFLDAAGLARAA
jgi:pimeloyl-ACP methyl ester carboxylesterase